MHRYVFSLLIFGFIFSCTLGLDQDDDLFGDLDEYDEADVLSSSYSNPDSTEKSKLLSFFQSFSPIEKSALEECQKELLELNTDMPSEAEMFSASESLLKKVSADVKTHHWCFYGSIVSLYDKLDQTTAGMVDRHKQLEDFIKPLWALARALDASNDSSIYFDYLRQLYKEINFKYFGRKLEVISEPKAPKITGTSQTDNQSSATSEESEEDPQ